MTMTTDEVLRVLAALEAAWMKDATALHVLAEGGPGERPLAPLMAEYAEMSLQTLMAAHHGVHDGLSDAEIAAAVAQAQGDLGVRMARLLTDTLKLWAELSTDPRTIDEMAHVLLTGVLAFLPDPRDETQVLPLLAQLRAGALSPTD